MPVHQNNIFFLNFISKTLIMSKKILSAAVVTFLAVGIISCKGKKKEDAGTETSATAEVKPAEEAKPSGPANAPKTYQLSFMPDSVILGKEKEAFIKMLGGEAIELQDADGKSTGMNIKFKLRVTNKSTLENKKFFNINASDSRLELDNGTNITYKNAGSLNPDPESSKDDQWEFETPSGTKPTKLNLFYDGTRVAVAVSLN
jgi:hypothetical protein